MITAVRQCVVTVVCWDMVAHLSQLKMVCHDTGEGMQDYARVTVMMAAIRWHTWMGSLSLLQCYDGRSIFEPSSGR